MSVKDNNYWYNNNLIRFEQLKDRVDLKMGMLQHKWKRKNNIRIHSYSSRIKERDSFLTKLKKDQNLKREELKDILGCRIICYSLMDVSRIVELLKSEFDVLEIKNKSEELGEGEVGYHSIHLVVYLGVQDMEPQYERMKFEIQVRTVFQDAWAVINHTKSYKHYGFMPERLKRALNLFSGTLELLDNDLNNIVEKMNTINDQIPENLNIIEDRFQIVSDYVYTYKLYLDLKLDELEPKPSIEQLQFELFESSINIQEMYSSNPDLSDLLKSILDPTFCLYDIAKRKIKFSERAERNVQKYMEKNITIAFESGGIPLLIPKLTYLGNIWDKSMQPDYQDPPIPVEIDSSQINELFFKNTSGKFITMGINRIQFINLSNDESKNIPFKDKKIKFDNIPKGKYRLKVKIDYEPSDDSYAKFETIFILK